MQTAASADTDKTLAAKCCSSWNTSFSVPCSIHLCPAAGKLKLFRSVTAINVRPVELLMHTDFTTRYVIWQTKYDTATDRSLPFQGLQLLNTAFAGYFIFCLPLSMYYHVL